jgi:hypothetical protein
MQKKTITSLGELRTGDRFTYSVKRLDVWQVMEKKGNHIEVNQMLPGGLPRLKYNEKKNSKTSVVFLRHTDPLPGEECFIEDLKIGDVFFRPNDIITEYEMLGKMTKIPGMCGLKRVLDYEGKDTMMTPNLTTVVLVRKHKKHLEGCKCNICKGGKG